MGVLTDSVIFSCVILSYSRLSLPDLGFHVENPSAPFSAILPCLYIPTFNLSNGKVLKLVQLLERQDGIVTRGTTVWRATDGEGKDYGVKYAWRQVERVEEATHYRQAKEKEVVGVAGFVDYAEIMDIEKGVRRDLDLGISVRESNKSASMGTENGSARKRPRTGTVRSLTQEGSTPLSAATPPPTLATAITTQTPPQAATVSSPKHCWLHPRQYPRLP